MTCQPLRLPPGADLRQALEAIAASGVQSAFVVSGIGSLSDPRIRFANASAATTLPGAFELLTLSGSVTPTGAHLHMTVSDRQGQVFGGHVAEGNIIRTTAEILLAWLPEHALAREHDPATGFDELTVRAR